MRSETNKNATMLSVSLEAADHYVMFLSCGRLSVCVAVYQSYHEAASADQGYMPAKVAIVDVNNLGWLAAIWLLLL